MDNNIAPYLEEHRPENQECIDGVPINPNLRSSFDNTPNEERDSLETEDWWNRPFITTERCEDNLESWEEYVERLKDFPHVELMEQSAFEAQQLSTKKTWMDAYPSGTRYEVRCLDGGAWDRSTQWGMVASLEEAMKIIKERMG